MKTFFNVIWYFPYFGFLLAIPMAIIGLLWCITIVGLPIGLGLLQIAKFLLAPHTHALISKKEVNQLRGKEQNPMWHVFSVIMSILYFPIGLCVAIVYIIAALANFCTLLGIPNGIVIVKMLGSLFNPVNKVCVPDVVSDHVRANRDQQRLNNFIGNQPAQAPQYQPGGMGQQMPYSAPAQEPANPVRHYTDEMLAKVVDNSILYNPTLVEQCKAEQELRLKAQELMPVAEEYSIERLREIKFNPENFSPILVYCVETILFKREKEEEDERRRIAQEEAEKKREEYEQRREEAIDFLKKWKFAIAGGVALVIGLSVWLWNTSDNHRYNVIKDAANNNDFSTVIEYAYKFDNPKSSYFDAANTVGLSAIFNTEDLSAEDLDKHAKIIERVEKALDCEDPYAAHPTLTRYYTKYLYFNSTDSTIELPKAAEILSKCNATKARYNAGVAYFLNGDYNSAAVIFYDLAFEEGHTGAYGYLAVLNIFGLCEGYSRTQGWDYLDSAPATGLYAMLMGDKALRTDGSYRSRLENAKRYYDAASTPDLEPFNVMLEKRRYIVKNCLNKSTGYEYSYNFNGGKYIGQTTDYGRAADGWGVFLFTKLGDVKFGEYRYHGSTIQDVDNLYIYKPGKDYESWIYSAEKERSYNILDDGSIYVERMGKAKGTECFYSFNPHWYYNSNVEDDFFSSILWLDPAIVNP